MSERERKRTTVFSGKTSCCPTNSGQFLVSWFGVSEKQKESWGEAVKHDEGAGGMIYEER